MLWVLIRIASPHMLWVLIRIASGEAILMSTHNVCFYGKIIKINPKLSSNTRAQNNNASFNLRLTLSERRKV